MKHPFITTPRNLIKHLFFKKLQYSCLDLMKLRQYIEIMSGSSLSVFHNKITQLPEKTFLNVCRKTQIQNSERNAR